MDHLEHDQFKDCAVTVEHIDTALKIWGKNIGALKGKTTWMEPDLVARDFVKVPVELLKLHKEVYITADLFFANKIPFFLMLSCKICLRQSNTLQTELFHKYLRHSRRSTSTISNMAFALQWYMQMGNLHPSRF
jgi:hypothetical protein